MKGIGVILPIGSGKMPSRESEKEDSGSDSPSPGALAAEAFCTAKDAGDYDGVFSAFKEMFKIVDEEDDEQETPDMGMMEG